MTDEREPNAEPATGTNEVPAPGATEGSTEPVVEPTAPAVPNPAPGTPNTAAATPSLFQDRELTPVEQKRLDVARMQPKPWEPSDAELDPNSDTGWDEAAGHELIAIRPEDVPAVQTVAAPPPAPITPLIPPAAADAAADAAATASAAGATGAASAASTVAPATTSSNWARAGLPASTAAGWVPSDADTTFGAPAAATAPAATAAAATTLAEPTALAPVPAGPSRARRAGRAAKAGTLAATRPVMLIILFVGGILLGATAWNRQQVAVQAAAVPPPVVADRGTTDTIPPQIQSLLAALRSDNMASVQLVVPAAPYRLLAGELAAEGVADIGAAGALSTFTSGSDTATEILIQGQDLSGQYVAFNLVVHMHDGVITDFR
jgi:hypothetical protein